MSTVPAFTVPVHVFKTAPPEVSVLVPVTERVVGLDRLYAEYAAPFRANGTPYEFLFLVEPGAADVRRSLHPLIELGEPIRVLEIGRAASESLLLQAGAYHARASTVLTIPATQRLEAGALPRLIAALEEDVDLVVARRWPRRDGWLGRLQSRVLHFLFARLSGDRGHDITCGVQALRRDVLLDLPLYGHLHLFLPLLAMREGYRVSEIDAPQHPNDASSGVLGPADYLHRLVDLLLVYFLLFFTDKPLRFFGTAGSLVSAAGGALLLLIFVQRLFGEPAADRPMLVLGTLLLVMGMQSIALGLIGEIVVHFNAPHKRPYRLARTNGRDTARDAVEDLEPYVGSSSLS